MYGEQKNCSNSNRSLLLPLLLEKPAAWITSVPDEDGVTVETSRTYPCCVLKLSTLATIDIVPLMASRQPGGNSRDLFSDYDDFINPGTCWIRNLKIALFQRR